ncbi:MAG: murein DD-endopeptidase MepM/ murein hydrolase activator NlpD [Myxococcota bacterium]|jgi:murein DD-endopeptidase MepM/ murein hydrolase activator NlpD
MYLDKPIPLRGHGRRHRRRRQGRSRGSALVVVAILAAVNYFLFFHDADAQREDGNDLARTTAAQVESFALRGATPVDGMGATRELDDFGEPVGRTVEGALKRRQTVLKALRNVGIDHQSAMPLIQAMQKVFDFRKAQVGDAFKANLNDEGQVTFLEYTQSPLEIYEVTLAADGTYDAYKRKVPTRVDVVSVGCALKSSLYHSISRCGESAPLANRILDLFAWDVDFFQDAREGDEIKLVFEKVSVEGRFLHYGRVLAAEYNGKFGRHRIVAFKDPSGREGFFKPTGAAVKKEFIKSPLKYEKVSATGQSRIRLSLNRASPVVYTARKRTPVWSVGQGTISFAGESGGLGRVVTVKHDNGYTSTYGHLGKIAKGIKPGKRVDQKTLLGKVGQSGTASGPQLLFSLRKNGRLVNPLTLEYTEGTPVNDAYRQQFDQEVLRLLQDLDETEVIGVAERRG